MGRRGRRVVPIPGASAVLARRRGSGIAGPRWGFEGFLPRVRPRAPRAARAHCRGRPRDRASTRRRRGSRRRCATSPRRAAPDAAGGRLPRADEAPRADRARLAGRARRSRGRRRDPDPWRGRARGRRKPGQFGGRDRGASRGADATIEAARARVEGLVRDGVPRTEAARLVATETGLLRRELYRAEVLAGCGPGLRGAWRSRLQCP